MSLISSNEGVVYITSHADKKYVVKILDLNTEELDIYRRLLPLDPASPNHTLPCEIGEQGHPLLIMPLIRDIGSLAGWRNPNWTLYELLGIFLQVVEVGRSYTAALHTC